MAYICVEYAIRYSVLTRWIFYITPCITYIQQESDEISVKLRWSVIFYTQVLQCFGREVSFLRADTIQRIQPSRFTCSARIRVKIIRINQGISGLIVSGVFPHRAPRIEEAHGLYPKNRQIVEKVHYFRYLFEAQKLSVASPIVLIEMHELSS